MYAVSGNSWRAINSAKDLLPGETLSETAPEPTQEPEVTEIGFSLPVKAPDFIVASPIPKSDPLEALTEAEKEAKKPHGTDKSIPAIVLNLMVYIEHLELRIQKLEKGGKI
jgi:hypothetical protein